MFYVYKWYIENTGEIIYIGKGCGNRYKQTAKRNKLFQEYITAFVCKPEIILYFDDEAECFKEEHRLIAKYKSMGECKCNLDNGGVGGCHFVWTDEMKDYFSKYNVSKRDEQRKRMSDNNPMKNKNIAKLVGEKIGHKVVVGNTHYKSKTDCAKNYGISISGLAYWIKRGYTSDLQPIRNYNDIEQPIVIKPQHLGTPNKVVYNGVLYMSQKEVAKQTNHTETTIHQWLKYGFDNNGNSIRRYGDTKQYVYNPKNYKNFSSPIIFNGKYYKDVKECAKLNNISISSVRRACQKNNENNKYVNLQPSRAKSDNSSTEGSTTNG